MPIAEVSVSTNLEASEADPEVEEAWDQEVDRREAELESGVTTEVPGQEAIARLRARLSR
jgi:hypothetical protein